MRIIGRYCCNGMTVIEDLDLGNQIISHIIHIDRTGLAHTHNGFFQLRKVSAGDDSMDTLQFGSLRSVDGFEPSMGVGTA